MATQMYSTRVIEELSANIASHISSTDGKGNSRPNNSRIQRLQEHVQNTLIIVYSIVYSTNSRSPYRVQCKGSSIVFLHSINLR